MKKGEKKGNGRRHSFESRQSGLRSAVPKKESGCEKEGVEHHCHWRLQENQLK